MNKDKPSYQELENRIKQLEKELEINRLSTNNDFYF